MHKVSQRKPAATPKNSPSDELSDGNRVISAWAEAMDGWMLFLRADRKPKTVEFNRGQLLLLRRWCEGQNLAPTDFQGRHLRKYLALRADGTLAQSGEPISPTTRHHDATIARAFFKWLWKNGFVENNPLGDYEIRRAPKPSVKCPSAEHVRTLLLAVKRKWQPSENPSIKFVSDAAREFHRARSYAIILGLAKTGARPSELLGLRMEDYDAERKQIVFADTKGNEPRVLPVSAEWAEAVQVYLRVRRRHQVNPQGPYLFVSNSGERLSVDAFRIQFRQYVKFSCIPPFTLYGLRHFAINDLAKGNLLMASQIAGHKDLKTTRNYLHADADWIRGEYEKHEPLPDRTLINRRSERAKRKRLV